ncbi:GIY-YIG nuclease family protein [Fusobacterium polymorphum]|uniref:GIY-YIG nuclease family protein n=1 Tax=Fusobacterium nucleatum subsp. polymorphum TaxID=76857 RepID=UPI00300A3051
MATYKNLDDIFADDFFKENIVLEKKEHKISSDKDIEDFQEINKFFSENNRIPKVAKALGKERSLGKRFEGIVADKEKIKKLLPFDEYGLLKEYETLEEKEMQVAEDKVEYNSIDDILSDFDDIFKKSEADLESQLRDVSMYQTYKNTKVLNEKKSFSEALSKEEFKEYDLMFKKIHEEINQGLRKVKSLNSDNKREIDILGNIEEGDIFIIKGLMLFIEKKGEVTLMEGRKKKNAKLTVIFENGTINRNWLLNSLSAEISRSDAFKVEKRIDENSQISLNDLTTGYIYILKSLSEEPEIKVIPNLYKIGFTSDSVEKRIANAKNEETYLLANVKIVATYEIRNFSAQRLEKTLHNRFADKQLDITFLIAGKKISPREWFSVPLDEIGKEINNILLNLQSEVNN